MSGETVSELDNTDVHFCIFIHGLWGSPGHLNQLSKALKTKFSDSNLHILIAKRNIGNFTYDGIELGAERVTQEVEDELAQLKKQQKKVSKISIVGYSLGGLIARYTIGLLYSKGYFDRLQPINFTTFATPHLGTRTPLLGWHNQLFNNLGSRTLSASGQQLWTTDNFQDTGRPILAVLADPNSIFMSALKMFKHRALYSNIINDRAVPFYTSCIEDFDPFIDLESLDIKYAPGYEDVILQHPLGDEPNNKPVASKKTTQPTYYESFTNGARQVLTKAPLYFFFTTLAPIGMTVFFVNSGIQSFKSAQRIQDHAAGKSGIDKDKYKVQLMIEGAQKRAEKMMEGLAMHEGEDFLPEGEAQTRKAEAVEGNGHATQPKSVPPNTSVNGLNAAHQEDSQPQRDQNPPIHDDDNHLAYGSAYSSRPHSRSPSLAPSQHTLRSDSGKEFPTLALTPEQFAMKESLDAVGFKKYPVHIHKANHSHAAIIVRMQRPGFGEGRVVSRHWTERFEV